MTYFQQQTINEEYVSRLREIMSRNMGGAIQHRAAYLIEREYRRDELCGFITNEQSDGPKLHRCPIGVAYNASTVRRQHRHKARKRWNTQTGDATQ